MAKRKNRRRTNARRRKSLPKAPVLLLLAVFAAAALAVVAYTQISTRQGREASGASPEELLLSYMHLIPEKKYGEMYQMLDAESLEQITKEDFIKRNSAIYEGIGMQGMEVEIISCQEEGRRVRYKTVFDTAAGLVSFENEAVFQKEGKGYKLVWEDSLIFPGLLPTDKVRVSTVPAKRGEILDRNGRVLAGAGTAASVGIVPGKLENRDAAIRQAAGLLGMEPEEIEKKLSAKWVKEDSFVPIKTLRKVEEVELMAVEPDPEAKAEHDRQQQLLELPGVMVADTEVRAYPLGAAAAHLVGYVQNVTAEDLEEHPGEGYTANSVIGRSGAEGLFERELKGQDGCRIFMVDSGGREKMELASRTVEHGKSIKLTVDAGLQMDLYGQFQEDKSCSIAMDPYTGEVLALVSTPSYDNNDFILGLSNGQWAALNEDENKPMYNRFRQAWCPGSTFKPVIGAIGLDSGAFSAGEDFGSEGQSWQNGPSWGSYHVTTLHSYEPAVLEQALVYSDNIYFAKAALKIGADKLEQALGKLGFQEGMPFEIVMAKSQYSNSEGIETEIQLADSGYGQGQVLVNPLHLACIYTAFCNGGNVVKPYLRYQEKAAPEYWIPNAFSGNTAGVLLEGMKKVVNDPNGTGYAARREDVLLAGKTGTAEIKASKEDTSGTELGWFAVFTPEQSTERPVLLVSMAEDVKERGGSGYVLGKTREVLERWFVR